MHGKEHNGRSRDRETTSLDQKLLSAFHVRLLRLETEIENISRALSMREQLGDKVSDRAEGLRREAANLRGMIQTFTGQAAEADPEAAVEPDPPAEPDPEAVARSFAPVTPAAPPSPRKQPAVPPAAGSRAGRLAARRRRGVRFQARIDIWDHDLEALVRSGELSAAEAADTEVVADAVEDIFDRWLQHRLGETRSAPPPAEEPRPAPPAASPPPRDPNPVPPPVIKPAPPKPPVQANDPVESPMAGAAAEGERRRNHDRRAGLERRHGDDRRDRGGLDAGSEEWGILIDDTGWGGPDVRAKDDRRGGDDRRGSERRRVVGPFS